MNDHYSRKDNEFLAWYPNDLTEAAAERVWSPSECGYYVHIPFCTAICDYCGFAVARLKESNTGRYLEALETEILKYAREGRLAGRRMVCGHFGGGTPSAIHADELMAVKRLIDRSFDVDPSAEVTVEVNPLSFSPEKGQRYREHGVNRISIGIQSFDDRILRTIGRPHSASDVEKALAVLPAAGFDNYSLDLIYGVPGQSLDQIETDLHRAAASGAPHLTCFRLEIIPFTTLKLREGAGMLPPRPDRETLDAMDDRVVAVLTGHGYRQYGAFNFARPGFECVHNRVAFCAPQREYVGFGNSAYSYINNHIYCNYADVSDYESAVSSGRDPIALAQRVTPREAMSRFFVLGLKFHKVTRADFIDKFGLDPEFVFGDVLERMINAGLLQRDEEAYRMTAQGVRYVNNVCKEFFTEANRSTRQHLQFVPTITPKQIERFAQIARVNGRLPADETIPGDLEPESSDGRRQESQ